MLSGRLGSLTRADVLAIQLKHLRANAGDLHHVVWRGKAAVLFAILDDGTGATLAYTVQFTCDGCGVSGIDIDRACINRRREQAQKAQTDKRGDDRLL